MGDRCGKDRGISVQAGDKDRVIQEMLEVSGMLPKVPFPPAARGSALCRDASQVR